MLFCKIYIFSINQMSTAKLLNKLFRKSNVTLIIKRFSLSCTYENIMGFIM